MNDDQHVAIFWDYENCTPPCTIPGYDIVNNIRQIAHIYGGVKLFKAYLEVSEQSSSKPLGLRSELQSCGVSLTDCPHNGRKDVADKMMIVDMLTYAIDTPAPATIVLISGDRDFVYAVSVLRLRRYSVVLIAPTTAHDSLRSQASAILDWEFDVLGKTRESIQQDVNFDATETDNVFQSSHRRAQRSPVVQQGHRRLSFRDLAGAEALPPAEAISSQRARSLRASARSTTGNFHRSPDSTGDNTPSPAFLTPVRGSTTMPLSEDIFKADHGLEHTLQPEIDPIPDLNVDLKNLEDPPSSNSAIPDSISVSTSSSAGATGNETTAVRATYQQPIIITSATASTASFETAVSVETIGSIDDHATAAEPSVRLPHLYDPPHTPPSIFNKGQEQMSGHAMARPLFRVDDHSQCGRGVPPRCVAVGTTGRCRYESVVTHPNPSETYSDIVPSGSTPLSRSYQTPVPSQDESFIAMPHAHPKPISPPVTPPGQPTPQSPQSAAASAPSQPAIPAVPAHFKTLVILLEKHRAYGSLQPLRTVVACALVERDRNAYNLAGVRRWREYADLAVKAGIIKLGGWMAAAWVSLEPAWYDRVEIPRE